MRTIRVNVTQHDIDEGKRCAAGCCPVARALSRVEGARFFSVGPSYVAFNQYWNISLPGQAVRFIADFDGARQVKPFSFVLVLQ